MSLEQDLKAIWDKYEPQRESERNAALTQEEARKELAELNAKRLARGLPHVTEYRDQQAQLGQMNAYHQFHPPKTWRDHLDEELLACVRKHFG